MTVQHGQTNPRYCLYCNKIFSRDLDYMEHMNNVHGLPTWNVDADTISENGLLPVEKAFGNSMREYEVKVGVREIDLLHAMQVKSEEIKNIVRISVQQSPQKIQFGAVIQLRKPVEDSEDLSEESHKITIHVQSKMERVDFGGIADESFHQMVEQMLLSLNSFASHGSGWTLDQIIKIEIRTVKSKPIEGSSYLALPHKLSQTSALLNIRNREDENCFLYCFTAAYHLKYGPRLVPKGTSSRQITSPHTYGPENKIAKQPIGQYYMPMGFHQMSRFEELNNVRVNVFR